MSRFGPFSRSNREPENGRPNTVNIERETHRPSPTMTGIGASPQRIPVVVQGKVRSVRVQPRAGVPTLEMRIFDDTGDVIVVFSGRRMITGIEPGRQVEVTGVIGTFRGSAEFSTPCIDF